MESIIAYPITALSACDQSPQTRRRGWVSYIGSDVTSEIQNSSCSVHLLEPLIETYINIPPLYTPLVLSLLVPHASLLSPACSRH